MNDDLLQRTCNWTHVAWKGGPLVHKPRNGWFGKLLDFFFPRYISEGGTFVAVDSSGNVLTSTDGSTWTERGAG